MEAEPRESPTPREAMAHPGLFPGPPEPKAYFDCESRGFDVGWTSRLGIFTASIQSKGWETQKVTGLPIWQCWQLA